MFLWKKTKLEDFHPLAYHLKIERQRRQSDLQS